VTPRTLPTLLRARAESAAGGSPALHLRAAGGWKTWTWSAYWQHGLRAAAGLRAAGLRPGDALVVLAVEPEAAVRAILGAWILGAVPTPMGLPFRLEDMASYLRFVAETARWLEARVLVLPRSLAGAAECAPPGLRVVIGEDLSGDPADVPPLDEPHPIALVQLTSGSTGRPRGVVIPHPRLARHLEAMAQALPVAEGTAAGVSWLPLYHDMGLIGGLLFPLYAGFEVRLSSPQDFRSRPWTWLQDLSDFGAVITAAPPSAWMLGVRLAERAIAAGLDLSRLRCALVGAEPIGARVLREFASAFAPCGFREEAFFPCYGLAEATLAVTFPRLMTARRFDRVDGRALGGNVAEAVGADGPGATTFVGVGGPIPGTAVRIVGEDGGDVGERRVGEIWVRSDTLMAGYHRDPEATAAALAGGWLRTGDLGYTVDGELFVTGRKKDVIIRAGQKLVPAVIEDVASRVDGLRGGGVAAVGLWSEERATQLAVVVAETRRPASEHAELARAVREALKSHGLSVDAVHLVGPGTLPKTTSGKLVRSGIAALAKAG
jgi:acyl-CoA synthetase (AMP-forming)/AMP-acid ligase II